MVNIGLLHWGAGPVVDHSDMRVLPYIRYVQNVMFILILYENTIKIGQNFLNARFTFGYPYFETNLDRRAKNSGIRVK